MRILLAAKTKSSFVSLLGDLKQIHLAYIIQLSVTAFLDSDPIV